MQRTRSLEKRLDAVERAVTDGEVPVADVEDAAGRTARIERVESRLDTMEAQVDDLEAAVAAIRGYVGELRHVNREVERTASAAVAAVDRLDAGSGPSPPIARVDTDERVVPETLPADEAPGAEEDRAVLDRLRALL
ncbi:putative pilin/flagellin, contains class III signal peptide [Halanaeroarchaeum sp. HSR-CO]|uniref:DUF7310 family coiled-coil domain-containing protein n=1 Tax=Halanaeroarchaeum sp. HSR-CO TaxID=2866382 RepID=UPI00217CE91C|nr:hypothetical protein [Halanaeroarchaeum sp. HSR-CO]UWG47223.1 putative pilin/flagellin, contains class III signal peptide [Halanaeroarchaeum sp. HSR-CO]